MTAADVFNLSTIENALAHEMTFRGQMSFLDATQNPDGSYTVFNGGEVWAGPLSSEQSGWQ